MKLPSLLQLVKAVRTGIPEENSPDSLDYTDADIHEDSDSGATDDSDDAKTEIAGTRARATRPRISPRITHQPNAAGPPGSDWEGTDNEGDVQHAER